MKKWLYEITENSFNKGDYVFLYREGYPEGSLRMVTAVVNRLSDKVVPNLLICFNNIEGHRLILEKHDFEDWKYRPMTKTEIAYFKLTGI